MANRDLKVTLVGEDKTSGAFGSASRHAEGFGSKLAGAGKGLAMAFGGAALGGILGVGAAFVQGTKDAASYQQITAQVAQTIKSTGGAAGVTVGGLKDYAGQLETMSGVDEELILKGQNVLLTFTGIHNEVGKGNDVFNQASLAASNLSATMGIDLVSANTLVGKALNDPLKGMTALRKIGVSFDDQQRKQIATMVKSGDTMGAQKVILGELSKEFGGAAKAAGSGLTGSIAHLKDAFGDMFRNLATALLPTLSKFASYVADKLVPKLIEFANVAIPKLVSAFHTVVGVISSVVGWFQRHTTVAKVLAGVVVAVAAVLIGAWVAQGIVATVNSVKAMLAALKIVSGWVLMGAQAVIHGAVVAAVWTAQIVASAVSGAASFVIQVARVVGGWVVMGVQSLIQAARMAAAWIIAMGPIGWVIAIVVGLVALIITHWKTVVSWTKTAWHAVTGAISDAWHWVMGIIHGAVSAVTGAISGIWRWLSSSTSSAWHIFSQAIGNGISAAINFVKSLPGRILSALGNVGSMLFNAGKSMIQGLINGAGSLLRNIGSFFLNLLPGWIVGPFKWALGIHSPSKVFHGFGANIGQGLVNGMAAMQPAVASQMAALANTQGLAGLGVTGTGRAQVSTPGLLGGSPMGARGGAPVVHIENYNEAHQSPHAIAESLTFIGRTR